MHAAVKAPLGARRDLKNRSTVNPARPDIGDCSMAEDLGRDFGGPSAAKLRHINIVIQATPGQKLQIVRSLQALRRNGRRRQ